MKKSRERLKPSPAPAITAGHGNVCNGANSNNVVSATYLNGFTKKKDNK
jgi:hypothetical protein